MRVGIIGLGAMGGAYARNLLAGGITVDGFDPDPAAQDMLNKAGGTPQSSYGDWLCECEMIILSLANTKIAEYLVVSFSLVRSAYFWIFLSVSSHTVVGCPPLSVKHVFCDSQVGAHGS